jgi:hypothetical protein
MGRLAAAAANLVRGMDRSVDGIVPKGCLLDASPQSMIRDPSDEKTEVAAWVTSSCRDLVHPQGVGAIVGVTVSVGPGVVGGPACAMTSSITVPASTTSSRCVWRNTVPSGWMLL